MKDLRKALIVGVMSLTVFSMSMLAVPVQVSAASAGDLIKMDGLSSVYYLGADNKRYVFPNETTYFSWYPDFSGVVTVSQSELESYPLGANVTIRPGTKLVKITTDPKVYAVEPNGMLLHIPDEATAIALWGENWAQRVVDVPDAFFTNYTISSETVSATAYPTGSLIKTADDPTVYYIAADGTARKIADEAAFTANRFSFDNVITTTLEIPTLGDDITGAVSDIIDTSSGAGGTAGAGTGLSVSIASDTPEAGNIPAASPVDFLKFNLTASNDGDVTVTSIKLRGYDLGDSTNIDNVTLYDDGTKLGNSKNVNSDREATFNLSTPLVIPAGTTKTIRVRATIASGSAGNYALGIASASDIITNGAAVSGSFPVIGNSKAIVTGTNIGTITMSSVTTDGSATAKFGEDNVLLASFTLAAANEPVIWESAMFKNGGTNNTDIVSNMRLEIDGDVVADGATLVNKYVTFNLDNYVIAKNDSVSVEVYGDMGIGNVNNTVNLYVANDSDFVFTGQDYGYGIQMSGTGNLDASGEGILVTLSAGDFTIDMDKTATPARDARPGDTNAVLATIKMTSNAENATTNGLSGTSENFTISGTGLMCNEFDQAELYDVDTSAIYDLTVASGTTANTCTLTTDEEISFTKDVTKTFEVRVDLQGPNDSHPIDNNDTLKVTLKSGAFSLTGDDSDASITDITPSSVTGAIITVKTASLTWSTTALTAKTVVPSATDVIVYKASLKVGASSDVTLTSVRLDVDDTNYMSFRDTNFSQLSMYLNDKLLKSLSNKIINDGMTTGYINFTSLDPANRVIDAGTTATLEVKANFSSNFTGTTTALEIANSASSIVVKDKDSNAFAETVANVGTDSRVITLASKGTLKVELKVDDAKANDDTYLLAGTETAADHYLGELVFTTANEPIKVKTLVLQQVGSADSSDFIVARLYDEDGVMVAQEGPDSSGNVNFDTLNLELSADQATSYFIGVVSKGINVDGDPTSTATHGHTVKFTLANSSTLSGLGLSANEAVTAEGVNSGDTITCDEATSATVGTGEYAAWGYATTTVSTISGAVLTSISNNLADGALKQGNDKIIGKYTFVFDNGSNRTSANEALKAELVQLKLTVATTSGLSVSDVKAYVDGFPSNIATSTPNAGHTLWTFGHNQFADNLSEAGLVDGTIDLVITGDVTITSGTTNYVQTSLNDLDGTGSDFTYNGNAGTGSDFSDPLLDIITLDGATLSQ